MDKTLYEISKEFDSLVALLDEVTSPDYKQEDGMLDAVEEALRAIEMDLEQKTENIVRLLASWDAFEAMISGEESRLAKKRKAVEAKRVRLKTYLRDQMVFTNTRKIETPVKNVTLVQGREVAVVDDVNLLPQGTFDTEMLIKPDKKTILDRLRSGIETPGAHLDRGDPYLLIR